MTAAPRTFLSRHERRLLSQVTLHLESGVRLRRRPDAVRAVLAADGRILDRADAQDSSTMIDHVRRIEKSRTRAMRRDPEALDLWKALVAGASSIVERREGSKRHYLVLENAPSDRAHRALTRREVEIVRMAARGLPVKLIAYGLGLSSPAVSSALASAAHKLGLVSRLDLVRVASLLVDTPARAVDATVLTETEREIFELVRMGLTNEEIARRRSRSVRTVANQVASVLRKTGSASRRAVVTAKPRR
jgi:DNA-binding CsgD family transcriptional regulator